METICGIPCGECFMKDKCKGCAATGGKPFGGDCLSAECYKKGGKKAFEEYKVQVINEFNSLSITEIPEITELTMLCGFVVNVEYSFPDGSKAKLFKDNNIYLGALIPKAGTDRFYGFTADGEHLLVCESGSKGENPEIIIYKKR